MEKFNHYPLTLLFFLYKNIEQLVTCSLVLDTFYLPGKPVNKITLAVFDAIT
jgi:hypothetical protein